MTAAIILPSLLIGIIIGIYEAILLHRDVRVPTHRMGHMVHALIFAIIAVFASMNVEFVLGVLTFLQGIPIASQPIFFRVIIGVIAMFKIHGVSAAIKSTAPGTVGTRETWAHSFIIGILIVLAPYVWMMIGPLMPLWLQ